jgi:hypothetical protein
MAVALVACPPQLGSGPDGGEPCATGFLGSDAAAPEFDMQVLEADQTVATLSTGDTVPMLFPPQGGRVIFVGVHATNVDGCGLQLTGALRDLTTQEVRVDSRTVDLIATGDGYGVSGVPGNPAANSISNFSNIPVCPNEWSPTNIYGTVYGLEVTIQDREGRTLTNKIQVTPQCGQPESLADCLCTCKGGYVLGESCADGGEE